MVGFTVLIASNISNTLSSQYDIFTIRIDKLFPHPKVGYSATTSQFTPADLECIRAELHQLPPTGLHWMISEEPEPEVSVQSTNRFVVAEILQSGAFAGATDKMAFLSQV